MISTFFVPLLTVWPVIFSLRSNKLVALSSLKSVIAPLLSTSGSSRQYYHKIPDFSE